MLEHYSKSGTQNGINYLYLLLIFRLKSVQVKAEDDKNGERVWVRFFLAAAKITSYYTFLFLAYYSRLFLVYLAYFQFILCIFSIFDFFSKFRNCWRRRNKRRKAIYNFEVYSFAEMVIYSIVLVFQQTDRNKVNSITTTIK